ncbi:MAG: DUF1800 domain-containing protein [Bacteroidetes bacterium]|nr:DUF1800 domain-containing protein [Bacteroidota bacterium]
MQQIENQHLLWRAAFGPVMDNFSQFKEITPAQLYAQLKKNTLQKPIPFEIAQNMYDGLIKGIQDLGQKQQLEQNQKMQMRKQSIDGIKNLNLSWLDTMVNSTDQLREKMSFFWHGHFACRVINIYFQQELLNIIRENALGHFGDLLRAVSKSPAMLSFLNNQQNKKQHPNENFAREVMELFTMGRGNYSEEDVKEGARAFTGWGFDMQGNFQERAYFHDNGKKTFLQHTGNFTGDDILDIILEQPATALFITRKIFRFFVNDQADEEIIQSLARDFYNSHYDIQQLMDAIFESNWFYEEKNRGTKIKSPIELIVGIRRLLPMELQTPNSQLVFQRALGQVLFYPPNVSGWPGGNSWIDSSTLMVRLRLPQIMAMSDSYSIQPKNDDDVMMGMEQERPPKTLQYFQANINWDPLYRNFEPIHREEIYDMLKGFLIQTPSAMNEFTIERFTNQDSKEKYLKSLMVQLMSTPEYQLC